MSMGSTDRTKGVGRRPAHAELGDVLPVVRDILLYGLFGMIVGSLVSGQIPFPSVWQSSFGSLYVALAAVVTGLVMIAVLRNLLVRVHDRRTQRIVRELHEAQADFHNRTYAART